MSKWKPYIAVNMQRASESRSAHKKLRRLCGRYRNLPESRAVRDMIVVHLQTMRMQTGPNKHRQIIHSSPSRLYMLPIYGVSEFAAPLLSGALLGLNKVGKVNGDVGAAHG